ELRANPASADDHLSYNKLYYGDIRLDQVADPESRRACAFLVAASIRHLADHHYRWIWPMDVVTLQLLIEGQDHDSDGPLAEQAERLRAVLNRPAVRDVPGRLELLAVVEGRSRLLAQVEQVVEQPDCV